MSKSLQAAGFVCMYLAATVNANKNRAEEPSEEGTLISEQ
jgi:hypothetical protein